MYKGLHEVRHRERTSYENAHTFLFTRQKKHG